MRGLMWARIGAIFGGLAVIAGTFGAHGLEGKVDPDRLETFEIGVRYQFYHAMALLAVGLLAMRAGQSDRILSAAGWLFLFGSIIFPGSLYLLVLAGGTADWLGSITPIGGIAFVIGWFTLAAACSPERLAPKTGSREGAGAGEAAEEPQRVA